MIKSSTRMPIGFPDMRGDCVVEVRGGGETHTLHLTSREMGYLKIWKDGKGGVSRGVVVVGFTGEDERFEG